MKEKSEIVVIILALICLAFSVVAHVAAFSDVAIFGDMSLYVYVGIFAGAFILGVPVDWYGSALAKGRRKARPWRALMRGCPPAMLYVGYAFTAYAAFNFILALATALTHAPDHFLTRGLSAYSMVFYYADFAICYSYIQVKKHGGVRRCEQGHVMPLEDKKCDQCGAHIGVEAVDAMDVN